MEKKTPNEAVEKFIDFLKTHKNPFEDVTQDEPCTDEIVEERFSCLKPKVVDVLLEAEKGWFSAMGELEKKHASCESIEDIKKLTKDILKLCK